MWDNSPDVDRAFSRRSAEMGRHANLNSVSGAIRRNGCGGLVVVLGSFKPFFPRQYSKGKPLPDITGA